MSVGTGHDAAEPQPGPEGPRRGGSKWKLVLGGLVVTYVLLAGYSLVPVSGTVGPSSLASASATTPPSPTSTATEPATVAPFTMASSPAAHSLALESLAAFGPNGTADGDNPGIISRVNSGGAQPWYSSWYATPGFGNLQSGTGLVVDMGGRVNVSSVQLRLGSQVGADVEVRVGNTETLAGLTVVASATDVGGAMRLAVTPGSSGRYVLVWFTRLPPNSQGKYQIDVYGVTVKGGGL